MLAYKGRSHVWNKLFKTVVLPTPEGPEMMINFPGLASADGWSFEVCGDMVLLDILNHFSNSLDACLDLNNVVSDFDIIRFRTNCVGFPQHFLN